MSTETSLFYQAPQWIRRLSLVVRTRVFELFQSEFSNAQRILDLGVTSERRSLEANFLEKLYPHKDRIVAAGIEDAGFLEKDFAGIRFVPIKAGQPLPFSDQEFDVCFSHAVIEHIVGTQERTFFLREAARVSKALFLTTPNRRFPVESHTFVPLLHVVWPWAFYRLLDCDCLSRFYRSRNLHLFTSKEFRRLSEVLPGWKVQFQRVKLLGFTSNFILILRREHS